MYVRLMHGPFEFCSTLAEHVQMFVQVARLIMVLSINLDMLPLDHFADLLEVARIYQLSQS